MRRGGAGSLRGPGVVVGRVGALWVHSSPNTVAAGPEHQALLPCGGSQVTGVSIAASLWLPSPGELPGLYPIPLSLLAPVHSHTCRVSGACVLWGVVDGAT